MWILLWIGFIAVGGGAFVYAISSAPWTAAGVIGLMIGFTCLLIAEVIYNGKRKSYSTKMKVLLYISFFMEITGLAGLGVARWLGWGFEDMYLVFFICAWVVLFMGIMLSTLVQIKASNTCRLNNCLDAPRDEETEIACEKAEAEACALAEAEVVASSPE